MKKNPAYQFGLLNPRILTVFTLCSVGVLLTMLSFGANPPSERRSSSDTSRSDSFFPDDQALPLEPNATSAAGDLDLTFAGFGSGGEVITTGVPMPAPSLLEYERRGMALQPDGKIVVVGYTGIHLLVMRYLPDGTPDATFGDTGIAKHVNPQYAVRGTSVAIQADGKIVAAGWADTNPADLLLVRLTAAGGLDPTFGNGGFVRTDWDNDTDQAFAVVIQPDSKIVAAGRAAIDGDYDFAVARYNPNGSLDTTFAGDGKGSVGFGAEDVAFDVALQEDGKLVLVGDNQGSLEHHFVLARLNSDGSQDDSFAGDGELTTAFEGGDEAAEAVAIQPDGKIVVAGDDSPVIGYQAGSVNALVARYDSSGNLDSSFDGNGQVSIAGLSGGIHDVELQPDGKIVLLGWHESPDSDYKVTLYRLNPNGSLDTSFNGTGNVLHDLGGYDFGYALALEADGRITAYGSTGTAHGLIRFWPDGSLDAGGRQTVGFEDTWTAPGLPKDIVDEQSHGMALQADGKIVLAGEMSNAAQTETDIALTRFLADGLLDTSFGVYGRVQLGVFEEDVARAVAIQPDGKIVVAGQMKNGSVVNFMVARFNANGSEDGTFGFGGFNVLDFLGGIDDGAALALAPDGKVVVAGTVFNGARFVFGVARFNSDGTPDNSFDNDAKQLIEFAAGPPHETTAVVVQPDLKVVVAGSFDSNFALVRLNENGSIDGTFGLSGKTQTDMGGTDRLSALALAPSGWFYAAGYRTISGNTDFAVAQYRPNGTLATCPPFPCSNWPQGKAFVDWGTGDTAYGVDVRGDGQIVAAGRVNGQYAWAQFRPNTLVGGPITGMTDFVGSIELPTAVKFVSRGRIVVAGYQSFNGNDNFALARFETTVAPVPLVGVVSRKVHGSTPFDINLPLTVDSGIECRTGGPADSHTIIFTFANPLTDVGDASVTSGTGSVSSSAIGADPHEYVVDLTGVANAQAITVTLTDVTDSGSNYSPSLQRTMRLLLADTTASGAVNSSDISQTKSQSGQVVGSGNFRTDVTVSGSINSSDISLVKSKSGTAVP